MYKRWSTLLCLGAFFACSMSVRAQPTRVEIPVLIPLTGGAAFIGQGELTTLKLIEAMTNDHGGIRGRSIHFEIQDTQTNPAVAVQLANALIAKKASVIVGPSFTSECLAVAPLMASGPVNYCISPGISPAPRSYVYSAGLAGSDFPELLLRYFKSRHLARIAFIASTDSSGQVFADNFDKTLARPEFRGIEIVARERFNVADLTANAQLSRMKAAHPDVAIEWTVGTAQATLLRGTQELGLNVPIVGGTGNTTYAQMALYKAFLPKELLFPTSTQTARGSIGPGPVRNAQTAFFNAFKGVGVKPDFLNSGIWDPVMIILDAYRVLGPAATADQLQRYIQELHGWVGITGIYDFRDKSQRGIGINAGIVVKWDPDKNDFVAVTRLGGHAK